jgi:O-antigen/teichoic acid export membrane protein
MGVVFNQTLKNTVITYVGFAIGGINTIYFAPVILGAKYYSLTNYILAGANVMMPLFAIGMQNTLVKFYSQYQTDKERAAFLSFTVIFPLLLSLPLLFIGFIYYEEIALYLSKKNPIVKDFIWQVPFIGFCMAYFEIFYAWARVHFHSVFGNFIKEVGIRLINLLGLVALYFGWLSLLEFMYFAAFVYFIALVITVLYAFRVKKPEFQFSIPVNAKSVLEYTFYIILSGSIANLLLDGDKMILNQYIKIENIGYYSVATYIALVISVPSRAMHQIVYPITAKLMHDNKYEELNKLYKKTSINLQLVGGFVMLGIFINIYQLYELLPKEYSGGIAVVFMIGLSKYFDLILGNNNAIIFNSKYYKTVLFLGLFLAFLTLILNMIFIPPYGIMGSAFATLLSITAYSLAKLMFVVKKMKLYPFTIQTVYLLLITTGLFLVFSFWQFDCNPFLAIILKSILMTICYIYINYKCKISADINAFTDQFLKKIMTKKEV